MCVCVRDGVLEDELAASQQALGGRGSLNVLSLSDISKHKQLCRLMWEQTAAPMGESKVNTGSLIEITTAYNTV